MAPMSRPVHFEIPADDPQKMMAFYSTVFGWTCQQWGKEPYWLVTTGPKDSPGIDGAFIKKNGPDHPLVNTMQVENLDATLAKAVENGGVNVVPKMAVPGIGWLAYCKDPEGGIFGMMQMDPGAA